MEEYFLEGTAVSYAPANGAELGLDGLWDVEPTEEASYKTRAYVVRPSDRAKFNGIVLVNWQNVTIGADFGMPDLEQLERGYAWIGITAQRVALEGQPSLTEDMPATIGLCEWDPERYGSLHHPGDAFSYDIFSQGAQALRQGAAVGVDMLGGALTTVADRDGRLAVGDASRFLPQYRPPKRPSLRRVPPHRALGIVPAGTRHEPRRELRADAAVQVQGELADPRRRRGADSGRQLRIRDDDGLDGPPARQ
jgi:hypothetical protein